MEPSLVIFDCDGVLVDSERIAAEAMVEALRVLGLDMTYAQIRQDYIGLSWDEFVRRLEQRIGRPVTAEWQHNTIEQNRAILLSELEPVPGVRGVIERLRDVRRPYCVASSGEIAKVTQSLDTTGLLPLFNGFLYSAAMVERGKPHPDLFLYAAEQMGHAPGACTVIEDSIHGVTAGRAAGMRVLAYSGDPFADEEALINAGGETFNHMAALPALLGLE